MGSQSTSSIKMPRQKKKENSTKKRANTTCSLEYQQLPRRVRSSSFPIVFCIWGVDCTPTCKVVSSTACLHCTRVCDSCVCVGMLFAMQEARTRCGGVPQSRMQCVLFDFVQHCGSFVAM